MAFETNANTQNILRDRNRRIIIVEDKDLKNPYKNYDALMAKTFQILLPDEEPASSYLNQLLDDIPAHDKLVEVMLTMGKQLRFVVGRLKKEGRRVVLPDTEIFKERLEYLKKNYDGAEYQNFVAQEGKRFKESLETSIQLNVECATKYGVPLQPPENRDEKTK